jgi:hypothetical protein
MAVLTTTFWLSVALPAAASIGLIVGGTITRKPLVLVLGVLGFLISMGWLVLALYVEAVIE